MKFKNIQRITVLFVAMAFILNITNASRLFAQNIYANKITDSSADFVNAYKAADSNLSNYAYLSNTLTLLSTSYLKAAFPASGVAGDIINIQVQSGTGLLSASLLSNVTVRLYDSLGTNVNTVTGGSGLLQLSLLSPGSNIYTIRLLTNPIDTYTFKSARVEFNNVLTLNLLSEFRVYNIFYQQPCPAVLANSVYAFGTNNGLLSGSVSNPGNAVDNNQSTYATLNVPLDLLSLFPPAYLDLHFSAYGRGGDYVGFTVATGSSLLSLSVLQDISITVYDEFGNNVGTSPTFSLADLKLLAGSTNKYTIGFVTPSGNHNIARAKINLASAVTLLENIEVFNAYHYRIDRTPIVISTSGPTTFCYGGNVTLTAFDSLGVNNFLWNTGATSRSITVTTSGTYSVSVADTEGCTRYSIQIQTTELPQLHPVITGDTILCLATTGVLHTTTPYSIYLWSNGTTTSSTNIANAGTYTVKVTDSNSCTAYDTVTVNKNNLNVTPAITANTCSNSNNGSISLLVTGGSGNYSYLWSDGTTTSSKSNLGIGTYTNITTDNIYHCTYNNAFTVSSSATLSVRSSVINTSTCNGIDGSITVHGEGGSGNYSYHWNTAASTATINNLSAGIYTVSIKDNVSSCQVSDTLIVSDGGSALAIIPTVTNVTSCLTANGGINITVTGGSGSYSYIWSNGATTAALTNLAPGNYYVLVKDNTTHCSKGFMIPLVNSAALQVNGNITPTACNAKTGIINTTVTNGSGSYTYRWNTGAAAATISSLPAGTYIVAVVDNMKGCAQQKIFTVSETGAPNVTVSTTNAGCTSSTNGSVLLATTDTHVTYRWSNASTAQNLISLAPGTYVVKVTDTVTGCSTIDTASINLKPQISLAANVTSNTSCAGSYNGAIAINATGGLPTYHYVWSTGATATNIINAAPGNYTIAVTDSDACTDSLLAVIITDTSRTLKIVLDSINNAKCSGSPSGGATAYATGGQPPYTYHWSTGIASTSLINVVPGSYTLTATDAHGCNATISLIIPADTTNAIHVTADSIIGASCNTAANGSLYVNVSGGTPTYSYTWSNGTTTKNLFGIMPASYSLTVTDTHGCTGVLTTRVPVDTARTVHVVLDSTIKTKCGNTSTGAAYVRAYSGNVPYHYLWSNGAASEDLINVQAGNYSITVTDAFGCTVSTIAIIMAQPQLMITLHVTDIKCYGDTNGTITASVTSGSGTYDYVWNTGITSATISALDAGNYSVTVKDDSTGCTAIDSTALVSPDSLHIDVSTTNITCAGNDGTAIINVSGGVSPYTYLWSNNSSASQLTGLVTGDYSVNVMDQNGCNKTASFALDKTGGCDTTIVVHNIITPNGDGVNDNLIIEGIQNYPNNSLKIFDKWGDIVYEQERYNNDWQGKDKNSKPLPGGTYFYLIKLNTPNLQGGKSDFTGYIMIQR